MSWIKAVECKPKYNKKRQTLDKKSFGEQNSGQKIIAIETPLSHFTHVGTTCCVNTIAQ